MFMARMLPAQMLVLHLAAAAAAEHCQLGDAVYRIEPWGDNSVRVRIGADPTFELPQQALLPRPSKPAAPRAVADGSVTGSCAVTSGNIKAAVVGGRLQILEASTGTVLLAEKAHSVCAGGAQCATKMAGVAASVAPAGSISFTSSPTERLYGLGEHRTGKLDNHGIFLDFMDAGVYDHHHAGDIVLPFYLSNTPAAGSTAARHYGFMWNMASFGSFNSSPSSPFRVSVCAARTLKRHRSIPGHSIAAAGALKSSLVATAGGKEPHIRPNRSSQATPRSAGPPPPRQCWTSG